MAYKDNIKLSKLKEGLQETVIFLRTLAAYKIPAVIERRRAELLDKLCLLQGDAIKEAPPIIEPPKETTPPSKLPSELTKGKESKEASPLPTKDGSSSSSSGVTSPSHQGSLTRRDSKVVNSLISNFETIHSTARKEEEGETPKRLFTLKKVAKPTDFPSASPEPEDGGKEEEEAKDEKMASLSVGNVGEGEGEGEGEEGEGDEKKKKGKRFGLKGLMKRDKSPAPSPAPSPALERKNQAPPTSSAEQVESDVEEVEATPPPSEEGVKISGTLERRHKKGLTGHKWVKVEVKVKDKVFMVEGKEGMDLNGSTVVETDSGFEFSYPHQKPTMFRVEGGGEDERKRWVSALKEAIREATPLDEEPDKVSLEESVSPSHQQEPVPSITINEVPSQADKKSKRESKALTVKPEKKLPDLGVAMKGYMHRKKTGLTKNWEKPYCVLTYQAMYFTTVEENKEYSNMLPISQSCQGKLSETKKGKGHDKHCQVPGLSLKIGKKVEQFSFDTQAEFTSWKDAIEKVLGIGGVEELLSEDEELDDSMGGGPEELYEELELDGDFIPPVPSSPRPARPSIPQDDFEIDEDIYEDTDEILPRMPLPPSPSHAPSLPERNPPKKLASPPPNLPPRVAPSSGPSLPPRNAPGSSKSSVPSLDHNVPKLPGRIPAKPQPPVTALSKVGGANNDDEELYDDVVVGEEGGAVTEDTYDDVLVGDTGAVEEEMYDDVVVGGGGGEDEEMYDDVVTVTGGGPITDEFYEDMAPGAPDSYVIMERNGGEGGEGGDDDDDQELYVDVDEPPSRPSLKPVIKAPEKDNKSSTFSRMFNKKGAEASSSSSKRSGTVTYKAPKKTKFEEKWAAIEGSYLAIHKSSGDKRSQDKIPLGDCRMELGSTEAGAGKLAFHLCKGDKMYHFGVNEEKEYNQWVSVLKGLVKYAPVESIVTDNEVYEAKEDHIGDDGELTFKRGTYIRLISKDSAEMWTGQIGNGDQVFNGKVGKFPQNKVELAEDLYVN